MTDVIPLGLPDDLACYLTRDIYRGEHSPCEHYAAAGYAALAAAIPAGRYDDPADPHPTDEDRDGDPGCHLRWLDRVVLAAVLGPAPDAEAKPKRGPKKAAPAGGEPPESERQVAAVLAALGVKADREPAVTLAGVRCDWHRALPELKVWSGQMTLETIIRGHRGAIRAAGDLPAGTRLLDWVVPGPGMTGLDARTAKTNLDIGFSPDALGMPVGRYAAAELLAVVGMQLAPTARLGPREYGYQGPDGRWYRYGVVERTEYLRMYTMSRSAR